MVVEGEVLVDVVDPVEVVCGVVEDALLDAVPCVMGVRAVVCVAGIVRLRRIPSVLVAGIMCLRRIQRAAYALDGVWDVDEGEQYGMVLAYEHVE